MSRQRDVTETENIYRWLVPSPVGRRMCIMYINYLYT